MYEKHIKALSDVTSPDYPEALEAAIALMRAAEPKDPAAEREHCKHVAWGYSGEGGVDCSSIHLEELIERERAAARAEGEQRKYYILVACISDQETRIRELEDLLRRECAAADAKER
jgi:hypothetical protein